MMTGRPVGCWKPSWPEVGPLHTTPEKTTESPKMSSQLPATITSQIPSLERLPERLSELLLSGDSPVVGPKTAQALRRFAAEPEPAMVTHSEVAEIIGGLAMATAQAKISDTEADAKIEMYWIALRDLPGADLRAAFVELLRTATFLPTPAEVRTAALRRGAARRYAKSRASHLAWKHEREWKPEGELIDPAEVRALLGNVAA